MFEIFASSGVPNEVDILFEGGDQFNLATNITKSYIH